MRVTGKSAEVPSHAGEIFPKKHNRKAFEECSCGKEAPLTPGTTQSGSEPPGSWTEG